MINVVDIYNTVRDLCNKDQKGFVTPEVFTTFAGIAQQNIFNEMFLELSMGKKARRQNVDLARDKSIVKRVEEDLAYFIREVELSDSEFINIVETDPDTEESVIVGTYDQADLDVSVFEKPSDLSKIISIRSIDSDTSAILELVYNPEDIDRIISSNLSTPTTEFPVALISDKIHIFPEDVNSVKLMYYRQPRSINPVTNNVDLSSTPIYQNLGGGANNVNFPDIVNCRHFELPEHYKNELIIEIAKMIGIRLRDNYLATFSIAEEKAE
jgi:hypothetical protein